MSDPVEVIRATLNANVLTILESGGRHQKHHDAMAALDALAAEVRQLREALKDFANPQHWAIRREFEVPSFIWIGTHTVTPVDHARAVLDSRPPSGEDTSPPRGALSSPNA